MLTKTITSFALLATTSLVNAAPVLKPRQGASTCAAGVHVIHARGSTQSQEEDGTLPVVNQLLAEIPGSSESDVEYPAAIISDDSFYTTSVIQGIKDIKKQIEEYVDLCGDDSRIVLVGYSQGGNVISSALAGGLATNWMPLNPKYNQYIKAAALFADPTHSKGQSYNYGDADGSGIFKRVYPSTTLLGTYSVRSYCAEGDFFCDAGGSLDVHYAAVETFQADAVEWIKSTV